MTFTTCMLYLIGGAVCLHYSFAVSVRPCPAIGCLCPPPSRTRWITNSNGCKVCSCLPKPIACPQLNCLHRICPNGFATKNNCPTCRCCPDIFPGQCTNGTVIDNNGCTVCQNIIFPCKPRLCNAIACQFGYKKDYNGCDTCECNPPICPQIGCPPPDFCSQTEYFKDENNCMKCRCKCPIVTCPTIRCASGQATDSTGCPICQCKPYSCPKVMCALACPGEFEQDQNGCQLCRCKTN